MKVHPTTDDDDLTCPITLQHGTSSFTRQLLRVEDLRSDDILKQHSASYQAQSSRVKLPPIQWQMTVNRTTSNPASTLMQTTIRSEQSNQENQESTNSSHKATCNCSSDCFGISLWPWK
ncbi:unnamed protein product [Rotaria socialis]|uniref:Uncharacterized protein n=1 Tax=Rotaria socialis TaxID=392032 RepID=A0A819AHK4_9BILA|nr:unnamed protein product [Rotaria socialis]